MYNKCYPVPEQPRGIFSSEGCGEAKCKQGEGDCDSDDDCVEGLICEFDGWWGIDYCVAGKSMRYCLMHKVKSNNAH